jgi:cob(I)alamin adenosyltransferase
MSIHINRVYTRGGDDGQTSLIGGARVSKDDLRIEAYGTTDELNSCLGLARAACRLTPPTDAPLLETEFGWLQNRIFDLGSELASPPDIFQAGMPCVTNEDISHLESTMDAWGEDLDPLTSFILPGGGQISGFLHLARTVSRRTERIVIALDRRDGVRPQAIGFLNRLSDYLFVLSRHVARTSAEEEWLWESPLRQKNSPSQETDDTSQETARD